MCWTMELDFGEVAWQSFGKLFVDISVQSSRVSPEHLIDRRKRCIVACSESVRCRRIDVLKSCAASGIHSGSSAASSLPLKNFTGFRSTSDQQTHLFRQHGSSTNRPEEVFPKE
jgi:hypothetical protein